MKINKKTGAVAIETVGDMKKIIAQILKLIPRGDEKYLVMSKKEFKNLKKWRAIINNKKQV